MTKLLNVKEISEKFSPVYGESWDNLKVLFTQENSYDTEVVNELRKILRRGETFKRPILLDDEEFFVSNGTHRLVASLLENVENIPVIFRYNEADESESWLDFSFKVRFINEPHPDIEEDIFDVAFDAFRSFPHNEKWYETDSFGTTNGTENGELLINSSWFHLAWEDRQEFLDVITKRAVKAGLSLTGVSFEHSRFDKETEEFIVLETEKI